MKYLTDRLDLPVKDWCLKKYIDFRNYTNSLEYDVTKGKTNKNYLLRIISVGTKLEVFLCSVYPIPSPPCNELVTSLDLLELKKPELKLEYYKTATGSEFDITYPVVKGTLKSGISLVYGDLTEKQKNLIITGFIGFVKLNGIFPGNIKPLFNHKL